MKHDFPDKIIFLDIDGVINTAKYHFQKFDEEAMSNLIDILKATNAKIVVSSSWRDEDLDRMFNNFREHSCFEEIIDNIIGVTVRGYKYTIKGSNLPIVRGNEIKQWVDTKLIYPWHSDPKLKEIYDTPDIIKDGQSYIQPMKSNKLNTDFSYVILDDDTDMLYDQKDNFINTDSLIGLTKEGSEKAIKILNYLFKID
jgi:hypothetical protein